MLWKREASLRKAISPTEPSFLTYYSSRLKMPPNLLKVKTPEKKNRQITRQKRFLGSTPMKSKGKRPKGINLMCRVKTPPFIQIVSHHVEKNWLDQWCKNCGNRMRINGKLYKKLASHLVDNPEDNSSYDELFQVVKKFRPDFINDQMLKQILRFFFSYSKTNILSIFRLTMSFCCSPILLPFIASDLENKEEEILDRLTTNICSKTTLLSIYPFSQIREWSRTLLISIFRLLLQIKQTHTQGTSETIMGYLAKNFGFQAITQLACILLNSRHKNYENIFKKQRIQVDFQLLRRLQL